jgi:hypothetical protein
MNSRKAGKLFIVLMISLVAFGFGSCANVLNSGNDITFGIVPSIFASSNNNQQISTIGDPSFQPVHLMKQYYNTTNSTNSTPVVNNSSTNNSSKNSSKNSTWLNN